MKKTVVVIKFNIYIYIYMLNLKTIIFLFLFLLFLLFLLLNFQNSKKKYENIKICDEIDEGDNINIIRIPNFITNKECKKLIKMAKPNMSRSNVVGKNKIELSLSRTSTNVFLDKDNKLVNKINDKLQNIVKIPKENYESPQIVRYKPKQFYKEHYDICLPFDSSSCKKDFRRGGYRIKTAIIYLTDTFEGGHTSFPLLKKKFKLSAGEIIIFDNIYNINKYKLSLHQGNPVKKGTKWILTIWIREKIFI